MVRDENVELIELDIPVFLTLRMDDIALLLRCKADGDNGGTKAAVFRSAAIIIVDNSAKVSFISFYI